MKVIKKNKVQNSEVELSSSLKIINFSKNKKIVLFMLMLLSTFPAFAVKEKIEEWGTTIDQVLKAAVAIFAVVGSFLIFIQYMQGNEQAQKNLIRFIIGLAIFGVSASIVTTFITP